MGVLHGRDIYSSKWITAEISDASNRVHYVPIKHTLGDYFLADILGDVYAFRIDGSRILQYRETLVKTFRLIRYDTTHYLPLSGETSELEHVLEINRLPKVDGMLSNVFKILGNKEKGEFATHKLSDLVSRITDFEKMSNIGTVTPIEENRFSKEAVNMINYLEHLNIKEIVTPLKGVSEFIQDDLLTTDPKFMGSVVASYQRTDAEHRKITNTPITGKHAWLKFMLVFMGIGLVLAIGFFLYDGGYLDDIGSFGGGIDIGTGGMGGGISDAQIMQQYPTGAELRAAVDSGEVNYNDLSDNAKEIVDNTPSPTGVPEEITDTPEETP